MRVPVILSKTITLLTLFILVSCDSNTLQPVTPNSPAASPLESTPTPSEAVESPASSDAALVPGQYCYEAATDSLDAVVRLTVAEDNQVTGDSVATISDEANSYYSSYRQTLEGRIRGNELALQVRTEIENDVQNTEEIWTLDGDRLNDSNTTFNLVECAVVGDRFAGATDAEIADPLSSAEQVNTRQVEFAPGTSSTVVSNAVVRGDRDVYLLNAREGQRMTLSITALENNAAFEVLAPNGEVLVQEETETEVALLQTGNYQVVVGGTRGNASYNLAIAIR